MICSASFFAFATTLSVKTTSSSVVWSDLGVYAIIVAILCSRCFPVDVTLADIKSNKKRRKCYDMMRINDCHKVLAKPMLGKCENECVVYTQIQLSCALYLQNEDSVASFSCNVPMPDFEDGQYTSDFVCKNADGTIAVYECIEAQEQLVDEGELLLREWQHWFARGAFTWALATWTQFQTEDGEVTGLHLISTINQSLL